MQADTPAPEGIVLADIVPTGKQLLIEVLDPAEQTDGGIILPASAMEDPTDIWDQSKPPCVGLVRAGGKEADVHSWAEELVMFLPNAGVSFISQGKRWIIVEYPAILGVFPGSDGQVIELIEPENN
jgi:co-chaperonin GroES (HSP10)